MHTHTHINTHTHICTLVLCTVSPRNNDQVSSSEDVWSPDCSLEISFANERNQFLGEMGDFKARTVSAHDLPTTFIDTKTKEDIKHCQKDSGANLKTLLLAKNGGILSTSKLITPRHQNAWMCLNL